MRRRPTRDTPRKSDSIDIGNAFLHLPADADPCAPPLTHRLSALKLADLQYVLTRWEQGWSWDRAVAHVSVTIAAGNLFGCTNRLQVFSEVWRRHWAKAYVECQYCHWPWGCIGFPQGPLQPICRGGILSWHDAASMDCTSVRQANVKRVR